MNIRLGITLSLSMIMSALTLSACQASSVLASANDEDINRQVTTLIPPIPDSDNDGVLDHIDYCPKTPKNIIVDERGCTIVIGPEKGLKMELRAYFDKGSSELLPVYFDQFDQAGRRMNEVDTATMRVEGNISKDEIADSSTQKTAMIAKNRARAIKNYLIKNYKIAPPRITTFDCAANQQIAPNDSAEGRHINRRIYALVTQTDEDVINNYLRYSASKKICTEF